MAGIVHKQLFSGTVILAHDQILFACPMSITLTSSRQLS
jgi:hypothetical protein